MKGYTVLLGLALLLGLLAWRGMNAVEKKEMKPSIVWRPAEEEDLLPLEKR